MGKRVSKKMQKYIRNFHYYHLYSIPELKREICRYDLLEYFVIHKLIVENKPLSQKCRIIRKYVDSYQKFSLVITYDDLHYYYVENYFLLFYEKFNDILFDDEKDYNYDEAHNYIWNIIKYDDKYGMETRLRINKIKKLKTNLNLDN